MTELPASLIADTLNRRVRRTERGHGHGYDIPLMHVSSIIRTDNNNFFCPREFVLRYVERKPADGEGIPPKMSLLYALGHFYGDYVVKEFMSRSPEWAPYIWGDWVCSCGHTKLVKQCLPDTKCSKCKLDCHNYVETDLFNPARTVVGHADLIFCVDGKFYIYEFKSIERADVSFAALDAPLGDHLIQASNYYYMLKNEVGNVSKMIRFVYIDRSLEGLYTVRPFKEFVSKPIVARRLKKFYEKVYTVHKSIEKGVLPPRVCEDIHCSRARQCSRAVSCFSRTRTKFRRIASE